MADVKIRFAVNPDAESEELRDIYVDSVDKVSNTSFSVDDEGKYQEQPKEAINGVEALSFATGTKYRDMYPNGYLVFNADGYLANEDTQSGVLTSEQEPQEFVWGATDNNGYYEVKVSFRNATNLDAVVFYGDTVANQFPTMAYLDNSIHPLYSDDAKWAIKFDTQESEHSIRFVQWHRPNYNAVLTKIAVMPAYVEIDKYSGLKSVESLSQSTGQPKEIFYGVVPSTGSIEVIDIGGEIEDMVRDGVIPVSNTPIEIFVNENPVQSHISSDSQYNLQTKIFIAELSNEMNWWTDVKTVKNKYAYQTINLRPVMYSALSSLGYLDERQAMLDTEIIVGNQNDHELITVEEYLRRIQNSNLGYLYSNATTPYDLINEICSIAQLNMIKTDKDGFKFVSARPIFANNEPIISIPLKCQRSIPQKDLILKNKYDNVKYIQNELIENVENLLQGSYDIRDEDGNLDVSEIDADNVHMITDDNGYTYICFFKTITSSAELIRVQSNIYTRFGKYPFVFGFEYEGNPSSSGTESGIVGISTSDLSKEEFNFNAILATRCVQLTQYSTNQSETFAITIRLDEDAISYAKNMTVEIYGSVYNVADKEIKLNSNKNIYEFDYTSGLLHDKLRYYYNSTSIGMYDLISNNIIEDYKYGISTTTLSVICSDYLDINGALIKDWSKGEILQVGDIVQIDKDNNGTSAFSYGNGEPMRFRVTGRTFRKTGVPVIDLELQEVKLVEI